jgi:hypothetical protein
MYVWLLCYFSKVIKGYLCLKKKSLFVSVIIFYLAGFVARGDVYANNGRIMFRYFGTHSRCTTIKNTLYQSNKSDLNYSSQVLSYLQALPSLITVKCASQTHAISANMTAKELAIFDKYDVIGFSPSYFKYVIEAVNKWPFRDPLPVLLPQNPLLPFIWDDKVSWKQWMAKQGYKCLSLHASPV